MTELAHRILVAEDDADDQLLLGEALNAAGFQGTLEFVADGVQLMARLRAHPLPDLLLLDLNMPRLTGHEVLQRLRGEERLSVLPVIVLTTSGANEDITRAYRSGANTYLQKPRSFPALVRLADLLQKFWLNLAKLPA